LFSRLKSNSLGFRAQFLLLLAL